MKSHRPGWFAFAAASLVCGVTLALSIALPSPEIRFPQDFDAKTAAAMEGVLHDKQFKYIDGLYSHWPPAWGTTLVYGGDTAALQAMIDRLSRVPKIHLRLTFSQDLSRESGTGHSAGNWWVMYSHQTPHVLSIRVNLAPGQIDISKLQLNLESTEFDIHI